CCTLEYLESLETPTISISGTTLPPTEMNFLQIGFPEGENRLTNASLTTATFGDPSVSCSVKSRPAMSGIPILPKNPAPTSSYIEWSRPSGGLNPSIVMLPPELSPAISSTLAAVTLRAPGIAANC